MLPIIQLLVRHALTAAGAALISSGYIDAAQMEMIMGAVLTITGVAWSVLDKKLRGTLK